MSLKLVCAGVAWIVVCGAAVCWGQEEKVDMPPAVTSMTEEQIEAIVNRRIEEILGSSENILMPRFNNKLEFKSADGNFNLNVGGRIQVEAIFVDQNTHSVQQFGTVEDEVEFRRARLRAAGKLYKTLEYKAEYDFAASSRAGFNDVYIGLYDLGECGCMSIDHLRFGHQKEAFGLEEAMSSNYMTFIERGLPIALNPASRNTGARVNTTIAGGLVSWDTGIYKDTDAFGDGAGSGDWAMSTRVTVATEAKEYDDVLAHVGGSYSYRQPGQEMLQYQSRAENDGASPRFVDTGVMDVSTANVYALEVLLQWQSFHAQAEYVMSDVELNTAGSDPSFSGYYVEFGYFVTGQQRDYKRKSGLLTRIKMKEEDYFKNDGGCGAFELAARVSALDLNSGAVSGGQMRDLTVGFNWYLNPFTRFMVNAVHADNKGGGIADFLLFRWALDF